MNIYSETISQTKPMNIKPMTVKLCPVCFSAFRIENTGGERCGGCGSSVEPEIFWTDEGGDKLFKLVSDASAD